jgi:hypothetical protein
LCCGENESSLLYLDFGPEGMISGSLTKSMFAAAIIYMVSNKGRQIVYSLCFHSGFMGVKGYFSPCPNILNHSKAALDF